MSVKPGLKTFALVVALVSATASAAQNQKQKEQEYETEYETPFWEQEMLKPGANFYDIRQKAEDYFKKNYSHKKKKKEQEWEDDLYARYERWEWYWRDRVTSEGKTPGSFQYMSEACQQFMNSAAQKAGTPPSVNITPSNWTEMGPFSQPTNVPSGHNMGIITALARDNVNDIIYAGSNSGGIFKSTNGGSTWAITTDNFALGGIGVNDLIVDYNSPSTVYAATGTFARFNPWYGTGIIKTTNGGSTWSATALSLSPSAEKIVWKMAMHPTNPQIMYAITSTDVYKTTDGWATMSTITPTGAADLRDIEIDPVNTSNVYVCGKKLWRYNGSSWTDITNNLAGNTTTDAIAIDFSINPTLFAFYLYNSTKYIRKSTDGGNTWTLVFSTTSLSTYPYFDIFEVNPNDERVLYTGGADASNVRIYRSINGGVSWSSIASNSDMHVDQRVLHIYEPLYHPTSPGSIDKMLLGTDGSIVESTSGGGAGNWTKINGTGLANLQFYGIGGTERFPQYMNCGAQDNGHYHYASGTWPYFHLIGDSYENVHDRVNPDVVYQVVSGGWVGADPIYKYTNYGATYSTTLGSPTGLDVIDKPVVIDNSNRLYTGNQDVHYYNGSGWTAISSFVANNGVTAGRRLRAISVAESDYNTIYAAFDGPTWNNPNDVVMLKTTNRGTTWTDISPDSYVLWTGIMDIETDPRNPQRVWASLSGFTTSRVIYSSNGEATWSDFSTGLPNFPVSDLVYQDGTNDGIYAATDVGVYFYDASVSSWVAFKTNLPASAQAADLEINYCAGKIRASVYGRGLWESPLAVQGTVAKVISTTATWAGEVNLTSDIEIASGCTLTVTGTVNIPENRSIFIKKGGMLILDGTSGGGKLTSYCGKMWNGVFVEGTYNQVQTHSVTAQAKFVMQNNAVLEHSHNGVANYGVDASGNIDWTKTGGIIDCSNSKFYNNRRAAEFQAYNWANSVSKFTNCTFLTNQLLNDQATYPNNAGIEAFVTINDVDGILFEDNIFENSYAAPVASSLGKGIAANEAVFTVQKNTAANGNLFKGLYRGIEVTRTVSAPGILNILNNTFIENWLGVYLTGNSITNEIRGNSFSMLSTHTGTSNARYGILTDGTRDFNIVDNSFSNFNYAVYCKNSSAASDANCHIYANNFTDNYRSVVSQYNNYKLNIKCNVFEDPSGVAQMYWLNYNGIPNQGSCTSSTTPAGNIFKQIPPQKDIYNFSGATYFTYYHHNAAVSPYTLNDIVPTLSVSTTCTTSACAYTFDPDVTCDYVLPPKQPAPSMAEAQYRTVQNSGSWPIYNSIMEEIKSKGLQPHQLTAQQLQQLHNIAMEDSTVVGANARAFFIFHFREEFGNIFPEQYEASEEAAVLKGNKPVLFQNRPNPATETTEIKVFLPGKKGTLEICSIYGGAALRYELTEEMNSVVLSNQQLGKGMYIYVLKINDQVVDSKKLLMN